LDFELLPGPMKKPGEWPGCDDSSVSIIARVSRIEVERGPQDGIE